MSMRMAHADKECAPMPKNAINGRLKSDITENKEKLYERSYY